MDWKEVELVDEKQGIFMLYLSFSSSESLVGSCLMVLRDVCLIVIHTDRARILDAG